MKFLKKIPWEIYFGTGLILLSGALYIVHYEIFHDPHHIFIYFMGDLAFVPIEVLFVTLIIEKLLKDRERRAVMEKLNMVIGTFFSEIGYELLKFFSVKGSISDDLRRRLIITSETAAKDFSRIAVELKKMKFKLDCDITDLEKMKNILTGNQSFLLALMENPNLLEHSRFTSLLLAVFHLNEELQARAVLSDIGSADFAHITGDMERVYTALLAEWLEYMDYLRKNYPFLYSFAVRTNPFNPDARAEVQG